MMMSAFPTSTQYRIENPSYSSQTRKRNNRNPNWKGGSKTVIADDIIVYIENPIDSTKNYMA